MRTPEENALLMREEHAAGKLIVANFPTLLTIESTSICNLRCVMCPQAIDAVHRPRHMPEHILDSLAEATRVASKAQLHGIGEPLASPVFWRALANDAFHPDAILTVNTNLTLLNDRHLAILVGAHQELRLNVSLDAACEVTYRRIRGADFYEVTRNIARLRAARGDRQYPVITINMTLMRENIEEAPAFIELAHRLQVDGVLLWHLNRWPEESMAAYKTDRDGWHFDYAAQGLWNYPGLSDRCLRAAIRRAEELAIPVKMDPSVLFDQSSAAQPVAVAETGTPGATRAPLNRSVTTAEGVVRAERAPAATAAQPDTVKDCRFPWEWAVITTDGDVRPCCHATGAVGNLNDTGFAELWNGKEMQELRRDVTANRINRLCHNAACRFVQNMPRPATGD
jgi:radical SAM protein with 4Fe4S-binding SPASM domain